MSAGWGNNDQGDAGDAIAIPPVISDTRAIIDAARARMPPMRRRMPPAQARMPPTPATSDGAVEPPSCRPR